MQDKTQDQGSFGGSGGSSYESRDQTRGGQQVSHIPDLFHDEELDKRNSELQLAWSEALDEDLLVTSKGYKKVHVLMLSYEEGSSDMDVKSEIDGLTAVFRDLYNFRVTNETIKKREGKRAQSQVNRIVANWVDEHDRLKTLLIIYFAGHGNVSDGLLQLSGLKETPGDARQYLNHIVWENTEKSLMGIQSDVLQIFDCCYAGTIGRRGNSEHTVEFLAACRPNETTPKPGPTSFTSALIWALKDLQRSRFTTAQLRQRIEEGPDFKKSQKPQLRTRHDITGNERIVLYPLPKADNAPTELSPAAPEVLSPSSPTSKLNKEQDVVTLKFVFDSTADKRQIKTLGENLGHIIKANKLNVSGISWGGVRPRYGHVFNQAVAGFRSVVTRHRRSQTQGNPTSCGGDFRGSVTVQSTNAMASDQAKRRPEDGEEFEIQCKVRRVEKQTREPSPD